MLISGVDMSPMVLQQFRNGLILSKQNGGTLLPVSGFDTSQRSNNLLASTSSPPLLAAKSLALLHSNGFLLGVRVALSSHDGREKGEGGGRTVSRVIWTLHLYSDRQGRLTSIDDRDNIPKA